ncbi:MAG TPA: beta-ketoacyl-ACP synthase, partial [Lautropia sp.]|nr:beta-ketoacyl-ACP synthase [Lautropia sp.]
PLVSALWRKRSGLRPNDFDPSRSGGFIGRVEGIETQPLPHSLQHFDCRNHRLADAALAADGFDDAVARAVSRYGAHRVAVLVGTSTSGILTTETAYRERLADGSLPAWFDYRHAHNYGALPEFVRERLGLSGPSQCLSTACSSSAKVIASAERWMALGLCDAAVVGGVDSLCGTTLHGFHSLQVVSDSPCRPFDRERSGISLGEAAAFMLLEREPQEHFRAAPPAHRIGGGAVLLLGYGESADAWHMSAPHPEGAGAVASMSEALRHSGLEAGQIDFTCAHGTATRANDEIESVAIKAVLGPDAVVTSTKGTTGHTLGAAGALSAVIAVLAIEQGFVPATVNTVSVDDACPVVVPLQTQSKAVKGVLVNAFGFGGNNCSLVFGART